MELKALFEQYLTSKTETIGRKVSLGQSARALHRFAATGLTLEEVTPKAIEDYLASLNVAPSTQNQNLKHIKAAFRWGVRRGLLPDGTTAPERVDPRFVEGTQVEVFTPVELAGVLRDVKPVYLPAVALGAFAGLRPEEIIGRNGKEGLRWEDINWEAGLIRIHPRTSKTHQGRAVPINDALAAWLEPRPEGLVVDAPPLTHRETGRLKKLGHRWAHDILRHSYATYRLALHRNLWEVSNEMGNSPAILKKHYDAVGIPAVARQYFSLRPGQNFSIVPTGEEADSAPESAAI